MRRDLESRLTRLASLGEPVRRALYRFVASQPDSVSRDAAAVGVGVPRHVAKFHLDRLEADGLLETDFRRPPGRTGPGAGRPSKLYRRSAGELSVSLPDRRYELAGRLMAEAITTSAREGTPVEVALEAAAGGVGQSLADEVAERGVHLDPGLALTTVTEVLDDHGYEPRVEGGKITLANCPFHSLANDYTDLVCGMNLEIMRSLVDALPNDELEARLEPSPDRCCVTLCGKAPRRAEVTSDSP